MKWITGSSNHGCWLGSYEYDKRVLFENRISEGSVVFDIGANVGFYTLLASALVGSNGEVVAFEPAPRNLRYLRSHLRMNRVSNVKIIEAAVSDINGECQFDTGPDYSMGHISSNGGLAVKSVTIDKLVLTREVSPPTYMKIDVEGAELEVLRGALKTLSTHRPGIFLATHGKEFHRQSCEFLRSMGYELEPISAPEVDQTDEIFAFPRA